MEIQYRNAVPGDAAALLGYLKIVGGESDNLSFDVQGIPITVEYEEKILERLAVSAHSIMLLALDGEEIVGNACLEGSGTPRFCHRASLAITVRKSHWGQGIGSALIARLIRFAESAGIEIISLEVRTDNSRGIALYEKFGFRKFGTFERYFKINGRYFDAHYMTLQVNAGAQNERGEVQC